MRRLLCINLFFVTTGAMAAASQDMADVRIETVPVAPGLFMLVGRGGNIGLSTGADGAFLVDDQYAPLTERILGAIRSVTGGPVRFVINTHWHADHTGGNENMGKAGAIIVAHENVRYRMSREQFIEAFNNRTPPAPPGALPIITFTQAVTFHWNGDEIRVFHVNAAHTDGDAIVHFVRANAIHMGDTFMNGFYPFIDASSGGVIDGVIAAVDTVLAIAGPDTRILPGHGPLATREDLQNYRRMLATVRDRIVQLLRSGKTREEIVAARPTREFDAEWGDGFLQADQFVGIVYDGIVRNRPRGR